MNLRRSNFFPVTGETKPLVNIDKETLTKIKRTIGTLAPESGGLITCTTDPTIVDIFDFDEGAQTTGVTYTHSVDWASDIVARNRKLGYITAGIIHSHPQGCTSPSFADMANCLQFIRFFNRDWFYMPIVMPSRDGNFNLLFYKATLVGENMILKLLYTLKCEGHDYYYNDVIEFERVFAVSDLEDFYNADQGYSKPEIKAEEVSKTIKGLDIPAPEVAESLAEPPQKAPKTDSQQMAAEALAKKRHMFFKRTQMLFPTKVTDKVVVCVGCGGARHLCEDLARNGFNNFILIDGDIIEPHNVSTQGIFLTEIGKSKVSALKDSIKNINQFAKVVPIECFLDDDFTDEEFKQYLELFPNKKPTDYLIYGCCDSFSGNRRAANLALNLGIPYIGAGLYEGGYVGEIVFTYPGVTPACPRCMLEPRYRAAESPEGIKPATSAGSVNFVTTRLNATIGFISLMLLMYHEAPDSTYNEMLDHVKERNFVWIRMNPFLAQSPFGIDFFDKTLNNSTAGNYVFMDETLWLPQHPNHPKYGEKQCPLCGGTGDLRRLINKWHDTRLA